MLHLHHNFTCFFFGGCDVVDRWQSIHFGCRRVRRQAAAAAAAAISSPSVWCVRGFGSRPLWCLAGAKRLARVARQAGGSPVRAHVESRRPPPREADGAPHVGESCDWTGRVELHYAVVKSSKANQGIDTPLL